MSSQREVLKLNFLIKNKLGAAKVEKMPEDASFRKYDRVTLENKSYVLMDGAAEKDNVSSFIKVSNFLSKNGFSVPKIYAKDEENGFVLQEDFGLASFTNVLANDTNKDGKHQTELELYGSAIEALIVLHRTEAPQEFSLYDDDMLLKEASLFTEWYLPILNGEPINRKLQQEYVTIWKHLLSLAMIFPDTIVLRDYHADNLFWLPEREGYKKAGIIDFQDAVIGSPIYDIVSLLEDARRDVSQEVCDAMVSKYLESKPLIKRKDFLAVFSILAAQRNLKIVGFCARKAVRDKNSSYLKLLPRVWDYIDRDLKHPLLLPLRKWLDKVIPQQIRKLRSSLKKTGEQINV